MGKHSCFLTGVTVGVVGLWLYQRMSEQTRGGLG